MILELVDRRIAPPGDEAWPEPWLSFEKLERATADLGRPEWGVDLVLVDDHAMTILNGDFRGQPGITDVLSFPALLKSGSGSPDLTAGTRRSRSDLWMDPLDGPVGEGGPFAIGEVILAPTFILRRCEDQGWPAGPELALLVVHGCLHLLGWEHEQPDDRQAMQAVESKQLEGIGMNHPMIKGS